MVEAFSWTSTWLIVSVTDRPRTIVCYDRFLPLEFLSPRNQRRDGFEFGGHGRQLDLNAWHWIVVRLDRVTEVSGIAV
jgi:hypothetical protein